jgi:hypothetical protein
MAALAATIAIASSCAHAPEPRAFEQLPPPSHESTQWEVKTASGLEAICFVNALAGNPLSLRVARAQAELWRSRLGPAAIAALRPFERRIAEKHEPLNALLLKPFVAAKAESLDEAIALCDRPAELEAAIVAAQKETGPRNIYYTPDGFKEFAALLPSLKLVLAGLKDAGFEEDWKARVRPGLEEEGARMLAKAAAYNVVPVVEGALGFSLPSNRITFYLVENLRPYGNHVIPGVFASDPHIPDEHIVRTALHELLHDPCYTYDPEYWRATDAIWKDRFVSEAYRKRNLDYGYNNPGYFFNENAVRAMEQLLSESLGIGQPRRERFGAWEDGGMHVLAPAFYVLMREAGMLETGEGFRAFIIRMVAEGKAGPGKMEALYRRYFSEASSQ